MIDKIYYQQSILLINTQKLLFTLALLFCIIEIVFFPSVSNFFGCLMMIICTIMYCFFLKEQYIIQFPFSFCMLTSSFLYHYLPLPMTLIAMRSISYGMEMPSKTFVLETIMFILMCLAFISASRISKKARFGRKLLNLMGFYSSLSVTEIWILGILGCIGKIYTLVNGLIITENILSKILNVLHYYMYAPVIIFFPCLYKNDANEEIKLKNIWVWLYIIFICILNFATNSRNKLITPFCIFILLYLLSMVYTKLKIKKIFSVKIIIKYTIISYIIIIILTNISHAMLLNRNIRNNVDFAELISSTVETLLDDDFKENWEKYHSNSNKDGHTYDAGWNEDYIKNEWLNRLCNIRISDQTLYLGEKSGDYGRILMKQDLFGRILAILPQPIISLFNSQFDKEDYYNSRGDYLYSISGIGNSYSMGGYRVTSHLGDGYITFKSWYFIIQFLLWYVVIRFLNTFIFVDSTGKTVYSVFGLLMVYESFKRFENANGMIMDISYIMRNYWQDIISFMIILVIAKLVASLFIKK